MSLVFQIFDLFPYSFSFSGVGFCPPNLSNLFDESLCRLQQTNNNMLQGSDHKSIFPSSRSQLGADSLPGSCYSSSKCYFLYFLVLKVVAFVSPIQSFQFYTWIRRFVHWLLHIISLCDRKLFWKTIPQSLSGNDASMFKFWKIHALPPILSFSSLSLPHVCYIIPFVLMG